MKRLIFGLAAVLFVFGATVALADVKVSVGMGHAQYHQHYAVPHHYDYHPQYHGFNFYLGPAPQPYYYQPYYYVPQTVVVPYYGPSVILRW